MLSKILKINLVFCLFISLKLAYSFSPVDNFSTTPVASIRMPHKANCKLQISDIELREEDRDDTNDWKQDIKYQALFDFINTSYHLVSHSSSQHIYRPIHSDSNLTTICRYLHFRFFRI